MPDMSRIDKRKQEEAKKYAPKDKKIDTQQANGTKPPKNQDIPPKKKGKKNIRRLFQWEFLHL